MSRYDVENFILFLKKKYRLKTEGSVAEHLGISRQQLSHWKNMGYVPGKHLKNEDYRYDNFQDEKLSMPAEKGNLPVVGVAQAGPGIFSLDGDYPAGAADEYISRPHGIKDINAFGIIVKDRSMIPALRPQQRVVVSPNVPVENSDRVVVGLKNGKRLVAEWRKLDSHIELVKYNGENITVEFSEIEFVYKIVWIREL